VRDGLGVPGTVVVTDGDGLCVVAVGVGVGAGVVADGEGVVADGIGVPVGVADVLGDGDAGAVGLAGALFWAGPTRLGPWT
jgi:hypothetical protein